MHNFKSSKHWVSVLLGFPASGDGVVAGHDDALGSDEDLAALGGGFERVVVRPHLKVVAVDLLGTELFNEDCLLAFIAIPPDVV